MIARPIIWIIILKLLFKKCLKLSHNIKITGGDCLELLMKGYMKYIERFY